MAHALGLAARGLGRTWPNPAVGCVIVRDSRIVGRGWTQPGGRPHAEPMALAQAFGVSAGRDPRGLPVQANDTEVVGRISDMWVDAPEQLVRYLEIHLNSGQKRLVPMPMVKIKSDRVKINSISSDLFDGVPTTKSATEVTMLEEEKISAYYAGGTMYAAHKRRSGF